MAGIFMKNISKLLAILLFILILSGCRKYIPNAQYIEPDSNPSSEIISSSETTKSECEESKETVSLPSADEVLKDPENIIIASIKTGKYHDRSCRYVKKIADGNMKGFKSSDDAIAEGYSPCTVCFK